MKAWRRSIEARLLGGALGLVALLWCAAAALTWLDARHELDELLDGHLAQAAALLVAQQLPQVGDGQAVDAPLLHRYAPRVAFQVFHEGQLVLHSANAPHAPLVPGAAPADGFHTVDVGGQPWRVFVARGAERDVRVYVGEQALSRTAILRGVLRGALWPLALALPLIALALWLSVRRGLAPLRALGRELGGRKAADLQPVALSPAPSEMQPMLDALNGLFGRIARQIDSERRFTADAAHELRTPIAAIRAQAQVAMRATEAAERQQALAATLQGCDRAARLVDQLLTLARLDALGTATAQPVALDAVVRQVLAEAAPDALARGQSLSLEEEGAGRVPGDATLLGVLVRNLVDNAIRHAPDGARIEVRLSAGEDGPRIEVDDSGPGLAPALLARAGERFFRADATGPGSGLGLSIARRVAQVHGATLALERSPRLGGLRVSVRFPPAAGAMR
jgi:two-component system sensor histidine kinase QseC